MSSVESQTPEVIMRRINRHIWISQEHLMLLKFQMSPLWLPEHQTVKIKSLFRGRKLFWLSVGSRFNWNLMCGMWNSGSLAHSQKSTECAGFFFSLSLALSLPLLLSLPVAHWCLTSAQWPVVKTDRGRQTSKRPDSYWNDPQAPLNKWSEGIKRLKK